MSEKVLHRYTASLVFIVSLVVYVTTMAVTVSFWDSGEFIATSYILGIPHSPGTPLYVLVGRVFCLLPLALSAAQKVNLLSAFSAALGVLMAYLIMARVVRFMFGAASTAAGIIARCAGPAVGAFFLAFSDTYWRNASEAEVYALSSFVIGLCTILALNWLGNPVAAGKKAGGMTLDGEGGRENGIILEKSSKDAGERSTNLVLLIIYLLSLGIGFHLGTIMVYGGIFLMMLMVREKSITDAELLVFTFGFAVLVADMTMHRYSYLTIAGLLVFALLVLWSTLSRGRFVLVATALFFLGISVHLFLYIRSGLNPSIDEVDPQTWRTLYAHLRREQYPPIDMLERKAPILFQIRHFTRYFQEQFRLFGDVKAGSLGPGALSAIIPLALGLYGIAENYIRERKTWVLNFTNLVLNSAGLIIFLNFSADEVRERDYFYGGAFFFFSIFIGIGATSLMMLMLQQARKTGRNLARFVTPVAVFLLVCSLLPAGNNWYTHDRSEDYIPRDYAWNILAGLEPDAIIFTNGDNDTFPLWYVQCVEGYRTDVRVANLSLLNTAWYIRQVRDEKPAVPLNLTDEEIDRLKPIRVREGILWTRDLAVNRIIRATDWKRPIYFAVTVPAEVWERYAENLEMQGMVRRLVPEKGKYMVNDYLTARNLDDIFLFRGVLTDDWKRDNSTYKSPEVRDMFVNFSIAAFQLAQQESQRMNHAGAVKWAERSYEFSPGFEWPRKYLGLYYTKNRQYDKALEHYRRQLEIEPGRGEFWVGLAAVHESMGDQGKALEVLKEGCAKAPGSRDVYGHAFRVAATMGSGDEAKGFIRKWLDSHPDDAEFGTLDRDIDRILVEEFGVAGPAESVSGKESR